MNWVCVREYALLTSHVGAEIPPAVGVLDRAAIPESTFKWLINQHSRFLSKGVPLVHLEGQQALRLGSFVGVLQSPCGTVIEILPKTQRRMPDAQEIRQLRRLLLEMIRLNLHLPKRDMGTASLQLLDYPLSEWLIQQFLQQLEQLVQQGLRFDYQQHQEESRFLRGQLQVAKQLRQTLGRAHYFQIQHDDYSPNRPENRLLKTALGICQQISQAPVNWKLASELNHHLLEIPPSQQPEQDFKQWRTDKLMQAYQAIRPWCELIIQRLNPTTQFGQHKGVSLLFPMERLFEAYVATALAQQLPHWQLSTQLRSQYLCEHQAKRWLQLRPDLCLSKGQQRIILDTKWKLINAQHQGSSHKYGLTQADFYQLFAYGHKYLQGQGEVVLIYPQYADFQQPLAPFQLDETLRLWVLPFDLQQRQLIWSEALTQLLQP